MGISVLSVVFLGHCVIILRRICSVIQSSRYVGLDCYLGRQYMLTFFGDFSFVYFASLVCTDVILKSVLITGL